MVKVGLFMVFSVFCGQVFSQKKVTALISTYDSVFKREDLSKSSVYIDSLSVRKYYTDYVTELLSKGYSVANLDTFYCQKDTCFGLVYRGAKYTLGNIRMSSDQVTILESAGLKRNRIVGKPLDSILLTTVLKTLVDHHTNVGYPFAKASYDSVDIVENKLNAQIKVQKGRFFTFDSIQMEGKVILNKKFLYRFLDIKPGEPYAQEKVVRANKRLNDLQFVKQTQAPAVNFVNDKASLVLTLDPKPSSRFDFLVGVLPQQNPDGSRKWNITGDLTTELNNSFGQGEYIFLQLKRLKPENLELQLKSTLPYIAGLPVGSHVDFRIFKNASQNIDLFFDGGFQYLFGGFNNIKLYGSYRSSRLLEIDTDQILAARRLPGSLDVTYSGVGLGLALRDLDYRFNPSKGYSVEINTIVGSKKILPNVTITQLEGFENSYDTLKLVSLQADIDLNAAYYIPVKNWAAIKFGGTAGIRYNQNQIQTNELLRVGGNKLLRGFDEESILTDFYAFSTVEFRFLFDQNSYMSLPFVDYGITRVMDANGQMVMDNVMGVGMGLNFGTAAGIFNLSFAAGRNLGNPWDFGKMKIHFGYVNLF
ncbi:MAG TPA: POTRA domain-containing protein [Saprospiraceae bacterium]|nr:POTRA domain-containing protein [Saprospiraceae bacterium]